MPRIPEDLVLPPGDALAEAERLLGAGFPFQAHEVLEGAWKAARPGEGEFWQGLAQLAVGLTHVQRGNATGAATLLRRGAENLTALVTDPPHGVPLAALREWALETAAAVEAGGLAAVGSNENNRPSLLP